MNNSSSKKLGTRPNTPSDPAEIDDLPISLVTRPTTSSPVTGVTPVGNTTDPVIINRGNTVAQALKGTGFMVVANSDSGRVAIKDSKTGKNFFSYAKNSGGDSVIVYDHLADVGATEWNSGYVNAIKKAMAALGMYAGSNFQSAFKDAVYDGKGLISK